MADGWLHKRYVEKMRLDVASASAPVVHVLRFDVRVPSVVVRWLGWGIGRTE